MALTGTDSKIVESGIVTQKEFGAHFMLYRNDAVSDLKKKILIWIKNNIINSKLSLFNIKFNYVLVFFK